MNKLLFTILAALLLTPMFISAQTESIVSESCLIPVYNTDFAFPPEGGSIVVKNNQDYFARTYLPGCADSADGLAVVPVSSDDTAQVGTTTPTASNNSGNTGTVGNSIVNFLLGDQCMIPVYTTDFAFPAEGGVVIQEGSQLFFVPTYLPACAAAASNGQVVKSSDSSIATPIVQPTGTVGGSLLNFAVGDPCLVPVYTTDFAFPAEGGHIIQVGNQLYFAKTYETGCENSTSGGTIIK